MSEEMLTMALVQWLREEQWKILSFDYPGSGTGIRLHKNGTCDKNRDTIVPDIIAVKGDTALFFENKDRFCKKDFEKQYSNIQDRWFSDDVDALLEEYPIKRQLWGIAMPEDKYGESVKNHEGMVDFVITVAKDKSVVIKKMKQEAEQ